MRPLSLLIVALSIGSVPGVLRASPQSPATIETAAETAVSARLEAALANAGAHRVKWEHALQSAPAEQRAGVAFLIEHMPAGDLASLSADFLLEHVALAYAARAEFAWGVSIPDALFFNDVLPYASVSETRESWRKSLLTQFRDVVADCKTPGEAGLKLNEAIFPALGVRYSTKRRRADQSPSESIEQGLASCTGLSILLADACRAVCVPARLAGIPSWTNKNGNHTWVEVWDGERWRFTGAAEPSAEGFDRTWFQADAALADPESAKHSIYATSWKATGTVFPMVWAANADPVHAVNVTRRYLPSDAAVDPTRSRLMVRVVDADGARIAREVTVRCDGEAMTGLSRDEGFDTNDILAFELPRGASAHVSAASCVASVVVLKDSEATVSLQVGSGGGGEKQSGVNKSDDKLSDAQRDAVTMACAAVLAGKPIGDGGVALDALLNEHDAEIRSIAWDAVRQVVGPELAAAVEENVVRTADREAPYTIEEVGERPAEGWPLFIAMHGGGGVAKAFNDSQWRHMQVYYKKHPEVGGYLYVALRAPNDNWDGFYDDAICPLVTTLIRQLVLCRGVNPRQVYAMGYSHGGYGAFVIGPRIPHRFAAVHASASAPTPGRTAAENLRNTRFTYMIGGRDTAYGRADRCREFDAAIAALRGDRDDVFPVAMKWVEDNGHGGLPDRDMVMAMYGQRRNPSPRELTWRMTDAVQSDFFWLEAPTPANGAKVDAHCLDDNSIDLSMEGVNEVRLGLDARLVDLTKPLTVRIGGETMQPKMKASLTTLVETMRSRCDPDLAYAARVVITRE